MADTRDLKSLDLTVVRVRIPPRVPADNQGLATFSQVFFCVLGGSLFALLLPSGVTNNNPITTQYFQWLLGKILWERSY